MWIDEPCEIASSQVVVSFKQKMINDNEHTREEAIQQTLGRVLKDHEKSEKHVKEAGRAEYKKELRENARAVKNLNRLMNEVSAADELGLSE